MSHKSLAQISCTGSLMLNLSIGNLPIYTWPVHTKLQMCLLCLSSPECPAEVRSVEVLRTVGQNSLMIGWERPPLDELGCSNGTFVYGYRVGKTK